jgi:PqqD family protein of HPr-rel-A system
VTTQRRYCRDRDALLCVLEDIAILYHRASGQTHMMISPVPEILDAFGSESAATAEELHVRLERRFDLGERAQAIAEIETHLDGLIALGLVRSA